MAVANRWGLPNLGLGVGLRGRYIAQFLAERPQLGWLEVITDNHLIHRGYLRHVLDELRSSYPIVLHGVTLNIASTDPLDMGYVRQVGRLAQEINTPWVSDHLAWTGVDGRQSHDLLPVPYTEAALQWTADRIKRVQDAWGRPLVLENPSTYLQFAHSQMPEWEFMARLLQLADCGLLLDVNNIVVSGHNHGYDPQLWMRAVPWDRVCQFHVAGHTTLPTHKLDTHIGPVSEAVWQLYAQAWQQTGGRATLLEWDDEIPDLATLLAELDKAKRWQVVDVLPPRPQLHHSPPPRPAPPLDQTYRAMLARIAGDRDADPEPRLAIHARMYTIRLSDALRQDFAAVQQVLGTPRFERMVAAYVAAQPSRHWALERYGAGFAQWLGQFSRCRVASQVAALAWACIEAKLAPPDPVWTTLAGVTGAQLADARLQFAEAVAEVTVSRQARQWWRLAGGQLAADQDGGMQWVRVSRKGFAVRTATMDPAEAALWELLRQGATISATLAAMAPRHTARVQRQIGVWLAAWVADGAVVGVR